MGLHLFLIRKNGNKGAALNKPKAHASGLFVDNAIANATNNTPRAGNETFRQNVGDSDANERPQWRQ